MKFKFRATEPLIGAGAYDAVKAVLDSGYISPGGEWVEKLEERYARVCGVKYAVACSSGTAALHLALLAMGIGPGDEVIVPALTCPDTLNAVLFVGAKPVIVDVELIRYGMSAMSFEQAITSRTAAVMPVHLYGAPVEEAVFEVAKRHRLFVIEDAAQAMGASYPSARVGARGDIGCFSLRGDKMVGCGTGGMLTTNSQQYATTARNKIGLASMGDGLDRYRSSEIGYSFEMSNFAAALAYAQMGSLGEMVERKCRVAENYAALLRHPLIRRPWPVSGHVFWKYVPVFLGAALGKIFDAFVARGIEPTPPFIPAYKLPMYEDPSGGDWLDCFPNSEFLSVQMLGLPSSPNLQPPHIEEIAAVTIELVDEYCSEGQ